MRFALTVRPSLVIRPAEKVIFHSLLRLFNSLIEKGVNGPQNAALVIGVGSDVSRLSLNEGCRVFHRVGLGRHCQKAKVVFVIAKGHHVLSLYPFLVGEGQ